ncbi:MAG: hypothetical protein KA369_13710 [Spirochaetes bacterium]|nr:hypothetical protein [Spirochaetota bacterium]
MTKKLLLILVIATGTVTLVPFAALSNQMGMGNPLKINALGLSVDYARTRKENDAGLYASYRYGFAHIVSIYFAADAGYRFIYNSVNVRAGGQLQFIVVGLEAGLLCAYRTKIERREWYDHGKRRGPWAPGMFLGLSGTVPGKRLALFISLGGNFYFINHDHEFYLMATGLVNFAGDLERKSAAK